MERKVSRILFSPLDGYAAREEVLEVLPRPKN
jgi:hypothetical protein